MRIPYIEICCLVTNTFPALLTLFHKLRYRMVNVRTPQPAICHLIPPMSSIPELLCRLSTPRLYKVSKPISINQYQSTVDPFLRHKIQKYLNKRIHCMHVEMGEGVHWTCPFLNINVPFSNGCYRSPLAPPFFFV